MGGVGAEASEKRLKSGVLVAKKLLQDHGRNGKGEEFPGIHDESIGSREDLVLHREVNGIQMGKDQKNEAFFRWIGRSFADIDGRVEHPRELGAIHQVLPDVSMSGGDAQKHFRLPGPKVDREGASRDRKAADDPEGLEEGKPVLLEPRKNTHEGNSGMNGRGGEGGQKMCGQRTRWEPRWNSGICTGLRTEASRGQGLPVPLLQQV